MEVAAPEAGVLESIASQEGETVGVGDVLGVIGASQSAEASPNGSTRGPAASRDQPVVQAAESPAPEEPRATPVARRMAEEHGLNLAEVEGSGPGGRVSREDVEVFLREQRPPPQSAAPIAGNRRWSIGCSATSGY